MRALKPLGTAGRKTQAVQRGIFVRLCDHGGGWAIKLWHLTSVVGKSFTRTVRSALDGDEDDVNPAHW